MRDIWLQLRGLASPSSPRTLCIGAYIEPCVRFHSILDIMRGGIRWKFMKGGVVYYHKFGVWLWYGIGNVSSNQGSGFFMGTLFGRGGI